MWKLTVKMVGNGIKTDGKVDFESYESAVEYFENKMFAGGQPKLLILENGQGDNRHFEAVGSYGSFEIGIQIKKDNDPPKELGE